MTLYTSKVVAQYLVLSERRVRQLRDEDVIREKRPGLYDLVDTMHWARNSTRLFSAAWTLPVRTSTR